MSSDKYIDLQRGDGDGFHIKWGELTGRLSRGALYTVFLAAIQVLYAVINGIQSTFNNAILWLEDTARALGNPGLVEAAAATTADATPDSVFAFVIAMLVAVAAMYALSVLFRVVS